MKNSHIIQVLFGLLLIGFLNSCTKEPKEEPITGEALFSYVANGYEVTFTNESTVSGSVAYLWDFGDGETSMEKDPVHVFPGRGQYTVKLTVTDSKGGEHAASTKIDIDKSSPVNLEDGSFEDWTAINEAFAIGDNSGSVRSFKYDYDKDYIYFYIKQEKDFTDASIFDMLIDIDPDQKTGYLYGLWPAFGGAELLIENSFSIDRNNEDIYWLDFANYNPDGSDWDTYWVYDAGATADTQMDGTYSVNGTTVEMEWAVSRTKIPALKDKEKIKIVAWMSNQEWDEIGWIPGKATEDNPDADGLIIDMK